MKLSLEAVAALTGGTILSGDPELNVFGVASLLDATPEEASFLGNEKYFEDFLHTSAGIVLVPPGLPKYPENVAFVEVANPSMAFNALVKYFKASSYKFVPGIHPSAVIDPSAKINPDKVRVGAYTCIGAHCEIGDGTDIGNGCQIGDGVTMGENCRLHANVTIRERCKLGSRVTIQPGAVIGSDGFGFLMGDNGRYVGIDQVGIVELEDDVDIGANTTIDRARFGRTIIGEGTKIDNLVQIGHNVVVGKHHCRTVRNCRQHACGGLRHHRSPGRHCRPSQGWFQIHAGGTNGCYGEHSGKRCLLGYSRLPLQGRLPPICGPQEAPGPRQGSPFPQKETGLIRKLAGNRTARGRSLRKTSLKTTLQAWPVPQRR